MRKKKEKNPNQGPTKRKLNRYEEEQNFALFLMKLGCFIVILLNFVISGYTPYHLPIKNPFVWLNCAILFYMCLKGLGLLGIDNSTNFIPWVCMRVIELVYSVAFGFAQINWILYITLRAVEVLYIIFLVMDQMQYEFVEEDADKDKYADYYK